MKKVTTLLLSTVLVLGLCGCETTADRTAAFSNADLGPRPENHEELIKQHILPRLKDPESARFRFEPLTQGRYRQNGFSPWIYCWHAKAWVNAKNSYGGYTGEQPYWFSFRDGKILHVRYPSEVPQYQWNTP